jgi:hypothetical protein
MTRVVRGLSLLFTGLFSGFLLGVMVLENSLRGFGASVYTQVRLVELDSLDTLASVTLIPALVTTLVLAILARGNERWVVLVGAALLVVVFGTTLAVNLPINADQAAWAVGAPPADWADVRDRWQLAHLARTIAAVAAFAVLLAPAVRAGRHEVVGGRGRRSTDAGRDQRTLVEVRGRWSRSEDAGRSEAIDDQVVGDGLSGAVLEARGGLRHRE